MPAIYVIDTHALLALPSHCGDDAKIHLFFDELTNRVSSGILTFPNLVIQDCKEFAEGEIIHTWTKAVSAHRRFASVDNGWQEEVLGQCEEIADFDDVGEQTPVLVAAMALSLLDVGLDASIVTEDRLELPNRLCLAEACRPLDIPTVTCLEFILACGMDGFI
ncbi:hypothetical protein [Streptomyces sp. NPDC096934]|uniref:hypothetical protein n=1 Tax=Streptomyces sp. NPDC096934 TaxID=3155551 RepID=UPI003316A1AB